MGNYTVEFEDSKYNDFTNWCLINEVNPVDFIYKATIEKYTLEKYGDLNEKLKKTKETGNGEAKKDVKPKEKTNKKVVSGGDANVDVIEHTEVIEEKKPVKKTRVIKSR